jgi:hypothetical protein
VRCVIGTLTLELVSHSLIYPGAYTNAQLMASFSLNPQTQELKVFTEDQNLAGDYTFKVKAVMESKYVVGAIPETTTAEFRIFIH